MITYEKLFVVLEQRGHNKAWLRNNGIHAKTVDKLIHNLNINVSTINQLCNLLDCEPCDILTYKKDNTKWE